MTTIIRDGDKIIVSPEGNLVASIVDELKNEMKQALDEGASEIAIDLSDTEMMDSMGLGILIAAHNSLKKNDGQLELLNTSDDIKELLQRMRLDKHFRV